ncbi:unnamed protein product [Adineta ricciae]|uniref:Uncharacterized protein n=1 Tax=Adineta ricciae TaxID=249248 RepID=A0A814QXX7_ADIRI|nr:unnamed protein product [Adineta ricciae]
MFSYSKSYLNLVHNGKQLILLQNNDFKGCPMPKTLNKVATYKGDKENQKKKKSSKKGQQQQRQEEEIATDNSYNDSTED